MSRRTRQNFIEQLFQIFGSQAFDRNRMDPFRLDSMWANFSCILFHNYNTEPPSKINKIYQKPRCPSPALLNRKRPILHYGRCKINLDCFSSSAILSLAFRISLLQPCCWQKSILTLHGKNSRISGYLNK